jgi:hypothetical protein
VDKDYQRRRRAQWHRSKISEEDVQWHRSMVSEEDVQWQRSKISEEDMQWHRSKISQTAAALMLQFELSDAGQCSIMRQILRRS